MRCTDSVGAVANMVVSPPRDVLRYERGIMNDFSILVNGCPLYARARDGINRERQAANSPGDAIIFTQSQSLNGKK
jgi:hypothetical protein